MNFENKKQMLVIALALGLGLIASVMTGGYIQNRIDSEAEKARKLIESRIAEKEIRPLVEQLNVLRKEVKRLESRPAPAATAVATSGEGADIPKSSLALRTPAGKRAYTVRIDSLSAVGGMVNPGDFVDVIAHLDIPDPSTGESENVSSVVFQNIQVLAVGTNLQAPGGYDEQQKARALNLTFALTPEEAGLMSFMERNGKMQLALRSPSEGETEVLDTSSWKTLADYVFEKQGTELAVPHAKSPMQSFDVEPQEAQPFIQIFEGGREL